MSTQDKVSLTGLRNCEKELMRSDGLILYHVRRGLILPRSPMSLNPEITGLPEMVDSKSFYDTVRFGEWARCSGLTSESGCICLPY